MGYSTSYKGSLKITPDLTPAQIDHLRSFLGEDCRDHKNWKSNKWYKKLYYTIDLDLVLKTNLGKTLEDKDEQYLEWDGAEKSYDMIAQVNFLIEEMRKICPDFRLSGEFICQGDDPKDQWVLRFEKKGWAKKVTLIPTGKRHKCPLCGGIFYTETP